jgi:hypothetical protein
MLRPHARLWPAGVALVILLAACASGGSAGVGATVMSTATPTVTPTATAFPGPCLPAWENLPPSSPAILGGMVLLPPQTRVIMVDSAPGEADGTLCTVGLTALEIDQFMQAHLATSGWHYDAPSNTWHQGQVLEFDYTVHNPVAWSVHCHCGGI